MRLTDRKRGAVAGGSWRRSRERNPRRAWLRPGAGAGVAGAVLAAVALTLATPAGASASRTGPATLAAAGWSPVVHDLHLRAMPFGRVTFGRAHGRLTVSPVVYGLTPGSSHAVSLLVRGRAWAVRFSPLTANGTGQAAGTLRSTFTGRVPRGSVLVIYMGVGHGRVAREPIAVTGGLSQRTHCSYRLISVEVSRWGYSYGTPRGWATITYNGRRQTLTITVSASGLTPGPHAAHVHLGSCTSQGPVKYMIPDLVASRRGIVRAVRVLTHITTPIPARGWYLNIHQGNSNNILSGGQPTIFFRPLLCADIRG